MQHIPLTQTEKIMLRLISQGDTDNDLALSRTERYLAIRSLRQKGLIDAVVDYDVISDVRLSYDGKEYMAENPSLRNPINLDRVISIATLIISTIAIIVACGAYK